MTGREESLFASTKVQILPRVEFHLGMEKNKYWKQLSAGLTFLKSDYILKNDYISRNFSLLLPK